MMIDCQLQDEGKVMMGGYIIIINKPKQKQKQWEMQSQINLEPYLITSSIIFKYEGKKLISFASSRDRLVFLTETQIHIIDPTIPKHKATTGIQSENILRYALSTRNQICILYNNGLMEIRLLETITEVLHRFKDVEIKGGRNFPQLYWESDDIYVLTQNKLELFNVAQKLRKVYSHTDFIPASDTKNLLGLVESRLLDRQRIIIMQFVNKMTFNIVPISITYMPMQNITRFLSLYSQKQPNTDGHPPHQYLAIIIDNKILKIYSIMNMKQLLEIQYEKTDHQIIDLSSDITKEFLLVTFSTKKNKVTRNILYKVNTAQYYYGKDYFKEGEKFFQYQIQLEVKQKLIIFEPKEIVLENKKFMAVHIGHIRHYAKRSKGEVILSTLIINQPYLKYFTITKCKTNAPEWKELRQWKDIITSYIEMKNTLDMIDFNFGSDQEKTPEKQKIAIPAEKPRQNIQEIYNQKKFNEANSKILKQHQESTRLIEEHQKQMQIEMEKYEKLKSSLIDGAQLFKNKVLSMKAHEDDHAGKLQQQFYQFIREYLKDQDMDFDVEMLFERMEEKNQEGQNLLGLKFLQPCQQADNDSLRDSKQVTHQKNIPISKSSEKLKKNADGSAILNRTKSSTNEEFQANSEGKFKNESITSSLSERKLQVVTKSEENIQDDEEIENSDYDQMARRISQAIVKAFQPLEKKLDNLNQRLNRTESIHIAQLQKCQRATQNQIKYINNIDMTIKGYCQQLLMQFETNLQTGLKSYWLKIEEIDKKAARDRDKAINVFGTFIDQQIKSRSDIFDDSRFCIENSLIHLRRKLINIFTTEDENLIRPQINLEQDYDIEMEMEKEKDPDEWEDQSDV